MLLIPRAFLDAVAVEPGVQYHTATHDFGTHAVSFEAKTCYGQALPAEVLELAHAGVINEFPVPLGQGASMVFLHADGAQHSGFNENSLVVRFDLAHARILFMGDAEAGGRQDPSTPPSASSIEGRLLSCCRDNLAASVLVVGHHGSMTSSRTAFLDAVGASIFVVSSGPTQYGSVVLPDRDVIDELSSRGQVFRTDLDDASCAQNPAKIGPDGDGEAGGCDNVRVTVAADGRVTADYWHGSD